MKRNMLTLSALIGLALLVLAALLGGVALGFPYGEQTLGWSTANVDVGNGVGRYVSMAVDWDSNPVIAYTDEENDALRFAICDRAKSLDGSCTSDKDWSKVTVDVSPDWVSLAVRLEWGGGNDDIWIAYQDERTPDALKLASCDMGSSADGKCTMPGDWKKVVLTGLYGWFLDVQRPSIMATPEGWILVAYRAGTGSEKDLNITKCRQTSADNCLEPSHWEVGFVDGGGFGAFTGAFPSLTEIKARPAVSYVDSVTHELKFAICKEPAAQWSCHNPSDWDKVVVDGWSPALQGAEYPSLHETYRGGSNVAMMSYLAPPGELKFAMCDFADSSDGKCTASGDWKSLSLGGIENWFRSWTPMSMTTGVSGNPMIAYQAPDCSLALATCSWSASITGDCDQPEDWESQCVALDAYFAVSSATDYVYSAPMIAYGSSGGGLKFAAPPPTPTPTPTRTPTPTASPTSTPTAGQMHNCPQPGKWSISAWDGADNTDAHQALDTCGEHTVAAAYHLDPGTQGWLRWFAERPEISDLATMDETQAVITLGATGAATPTSTPTPTPTPTPPSSGRIAFQSGRDEGWDIYVMDTDGSDEARLTTDPADDYSPAWSPDGSRIAFQSSRDGNAEIYVMNADGTDQTRLTDNTATDGTPAWSPDGLHIAFFSNRDGNAEIYVMNADGSGQTNITNRPASGESKPAWSPDGSQIAFRSDRDGNAEIYVMDADGSSQTNLTNSPAFGDGGPAWSPDGSQIAFYACQLPDGYCEIYVMSADGSGQTNITNNPAWDADPTWSPDGSQIAFFSDRDGNDEVYVMNADGSGQTNITNRQAARDNAPAWSPAGVSAATVETASSSPGLNLAQAAQGTMHNCPEPGRWAISVWDGPDVADANQALATCGTGTVSAAYSLDPQAQNWLRWFAGRPEISDLATLDVMQGVITLGSTSALPTLGRIAFFSNGGAGEIYAMNADGSGQVNLTNNPADDLDSAWSHDGSQIAFVSNRDGDNEVYVMDADGSDQSRLTTDLAGSLSPAWSPDGSRIVFRSSRDGNAEICVMNHDGSGQTNLTNNPAWDTQPVWSPDGSHIAFVSDRDFPPPLFPTAQPQEIYVMNADGAGQTRLTTYGVMAGDPAWSPDGSRIAFVARWFGEEKIYVMNADGTGETLLLTSTCDISHGCGVGSPLSWSPDGSQIAFTWYYDGNGEIYVMNAGGTGLVNLTQNPAEDRTADWSPDGSQIAFVSNRDGNDEIYVMNADGTGQTRLTNNSLGDDSPGWRPEPKAWRAPITFAGWVVGGCPQPGEMGSCSLEIDVRIQDVIRMEQANASFLYAPDEVITVILWPWSSESVPDLAIGDPVEVSGQERLFGSCVEGLCMDAYGFVVLPDYGGGNYIKRL